MTSIHEVRVFTDRECQIVHIPAEYRFSASEVYIRRGSRSGELILSECETGPDLEEVFAMLDAARVADGIEFLELDREDNEGVSKG